LIVALSSSSPLVSVALFGEDVLLIFSDQAEPHHNAGGTCLHLIEKGLAELHKTPQDLSLIVADVGPGSFIGVRVGVTIAKTMAYALQIPVAGVPAFDLIDPIETVVVPSKRGEYFIRRPGAPVIRETSLPTSEPFSGYGEGVAESRYPEARNAASLLGGLKRVRAEELLPEYLIEPSISTPKRAFERTER